MTLNCKCIICAECDGTGNIWISFSGEYLGNHRCDDQDEIEECPECDGNGISDMCDDCRDALIEQQEKDERYWGEQDRWY